MSKLDDLSAKIGAAREKAQVEHKAEPSKFGREMNLGIRAFMEMLGVLLGSGLMGWALDRFFETAPLFLGLFVVLGIIAAFFNLYKLSKNLGTAIGSKPVSNGLQSVEKNARNPSQDES